MDILTKLKLYQHVCEQHYHGCTGCPYDRPDHPLNNCKIKNVAYKLFCRPCDWKMEEIEEIINDQHSWLFCKSDNPADPDHVSDLCADRHGVHHQVRNR